MPSQAPSPSHSQARFFITAAVVAAGISITIGVREVLAMQARPKLFQALRNGDSLEVENLASKVDINAPDKYGMTLWMHAAQNGFMDIALQLEQKGADTSLAMPSMQVLAEKMMDEAAKKSKSAMVVLIAQHGKILYERAVGYADVQGKRKANCDTKFIINSVTKQFVASAILKLQEENKLTVSDKLLRFYAEFDKPGGRDVTIHHLLTHTSGIHDYASFCFLQRLDPENVDLDTVIADLAQLPLDFEPGTKFQYSNSNYNILGRIVEKITGEPLEVILDKFFFGPLNMTNTGMWGMESSYDNMAKTTMSSNTEEGKLEALLMSYSRGDGRLYSTVHDLMRWNEELFKGNVLGPASLEAAFTAPKLPDGLISTYGYGWSVNRVEENRGLRTILHTGRGWAFTSLLGRFLDHNITVAMLTNGDAKSFLDINLLLQALVWKDLTPKTLVNYFRADDMTSVAEAFQGQYDFGPDWELLEIVYKNDKFFGSGPMLGHETLLLPVDEGKALVCRLFNPELRFEIDSVSNDGRAHALVAIRNSPGRYPGRGARTTPVKVDRAVLRNYTGNYDTGGRILMKGGKLFGFQFGDTEKLRPVSEAKFALGHHHESVLSIEFVVGESGKVDYALLKERNCARKIRPV